MTEHIPTPPAAGWYPDPGGQPGQRYYDGAKWTSHFTPYPPATIQPSVVVNNTIGSAPAPGVAVAVSGGGSKVALAVGAVFVGIFMLGLVAEHPWLLAITIIAALAGGGLFYMNKQKQIRDEDERKLAMRAEYENDLHAGGDPRGTHGRYLPPEDFR